MKVSEVSDAQTKALISAGLVKKLDQFGPSFTLVDLLDASVNLTARARSAPESTKDCFVDLELRKLQPNSKSVYIVAAVKHCYCDPTAPKRTLMYLDIFENEAAANTMYEFVSAFYNSKTKTPH